MRQGIPCYIIAILKNMFRFEPVISSMQGVSLFESGQLLSSLVGGINDRTLQARQTATLPIRWERGCKWVKTVEKTVPLQYPLRSMQ